MNFNLKSILISDDISIKKAIEILDKSAKKILLVVDNNVIKGVVTDGDIRRWILKNEDINKSVSLIMNKSPIYISYHNLELCKQIMLNKSISALPIVDENLEVKDIVFLSDLLINKPNNSLTTPVVIMAGGKGTRLHPYTKIIPKPLIPIGDTPIIERIMNKFLDFNLDNFILTVNYKKELIKAYFNDTTNKNISYIEEDSPLGTAGSLSLLKGSIKETFIVTNCDILIDANYLDIINYHKLNNYKITIVTALKYYVIPYGVINLTEDGVVNSIDEKPEYNFLVNTGMYILEPDVLDDIPENTFYDMPTLIDYYIKNNKNVGVYPISNNSWSDMGEFNEMKNMLERLDL